MANPIGRVGDVQAMLRLMQPLNGHARSDAQGKRRLLADLCRLIGEHLGDAPAKIGDLSGLSPRMEQTLRSLLSGDSEKQVAQRLGLSPHTVHVYVKAIYRKYGVSSRGELLARWVRKSQN